MRKFGRFTKEQILAARDAFLLGVKIKTIAKSLNTSYSRCHNLVSGRTYQDLHYTLPKKRLPLNVEYILSLHNKYPHLSAEELSKREAKRMRRGTKQYTAQLVNLRIKQHNKKSK
jgi:hypothetical protein